MRATGTRLALCGIFMIVAFYAHFPIRAWWSEIFVADRVFSSGVDWWDTGRFLWWVFALLWGAMIGISVALIAGATSALKWSATCGLIVSLSDALLTRNYFYTDQVSSRIWAYGTHVMPFLGSMLGALVLDHIRRSRRAKIGTGP